MRFIVLAGLFLAAGCATIQPTRPIDSPVAIQLYSFHEQLETDPEATLAKIRQLGFRYVESYPLPGRTVPEVAAMLKRNGLQAIAAHVTANDVRDNLQRVITDAEALGTDTLAIPWARVGPGPDLGMSAAQVDALARIYNDACPVLREHRIKLMLHVHGMEWYPNEGGTPFDRLLAKVPADCMAIELDIFWAEKAGQDSAAIIDRLKGRVTHLHVKDMRTDTKVPDHSGNGPQSENVTLGTGRINLPAVLAAARRNGVKWYILENETGQPDATVPTDVAYLRQARLMR